MNFLSPAFLLGLPLLAVPVVIHLLSRRQQKKISWGAMRFLLQAATRKRRIWKLTDLLLLLLRTAAFLFFIFALTRPLLPTTWLGGSVPREVILVLDQSMSMSRRLNGTTMFDLQLQQANQILDELKGSDSVRVLLAGESPEWLTTDAVEVNPLSLRGLREQIAALQPTLGAADLAASVREASDLEAAKDKSARVIFVITDGQRFGWRLDEKPLWTTVQSRLQQSRIPTSVSLRFIEEGSENTGNLAVNGINSARAFGAVDQTLGFTAAVQNHGSDSSAATLLSWRVNDQSIGVTTIPELAAGASTTVSMQHSFGAAGLFDVTCELGAKDDLGADNEAHLLVEVFERLPVLLVEDARAAESLELDSSFILPALGAKHSPSAINRSPGKWRSVFEPALIDASALAATDLSRFRCVILADVAQLDPAVLEKLEAYVQNGGGVWITLGARTGEAFFNDHLHRGGVGLAPMKLSGAVGDPNDRERFFSVRTTSDSHPATALLADFQRLDLDRARVYRRQQFDPFSGKDVSILLQAQGGEAVAVERTLGRGRVIVQAIPLGVSWSTLPLCQAYVALLHEWLWYLSEPGLPKRNLAVGEALVEAAPDTQAEAELVLPDGRQVELDPGSSARGAQFHYTATRLPGEYRLHVKNRGDTRTATPFYVRRNPEESTLTPFTAQDRQQIAAMKAFQIGAGLDAIGATAEVQIPKHPLEGWLLAALAFVLLGEILLAGWMTHRRNLRVKPVVMEG